MDSKCISSILTSWNKRSSKYESGKLYYREEKENFSHSREMTQNVLFLLHNTPELRKHDKVKKRFEGETVF